MLDSVLPARPEARRILLGTLCSAIGRGLTLPFLFIYLTRVRGLDSLVVGLAVGWMGVVSLLLAPVAGTLIDRHGARRVVLPLLLIEAIGVASYALVQRPIEAFGSATLAAVGMAGMFAGQNTILASVTDESERQRVFGLSFAVLNLGIGLGGVVAGFIVDVHRPGSFQLVYLVDGVTYLAPAVILLSLPEVGRRLVASRRLVRAVGGYRDVIADRPFVRFMVFGVVLTACGYAQFEVGFTGFSANVAEVSTRVLGIALAANTLTIVLGQLLAIRWLAGRSRSGALAIVGGLFGASWLVLGAGAAGRDIGVAVPIAGVVLCTVVFAIGETLLSPVMPALTNALAPDELRGRYNAIGSMIWGISAVIGPITAAPLIGHGLGAVWVVLVAGGCAVASGLALSLRSRLTDGQDGRDAAPAGEPAYSSVNPG